MSEGFMRRRPTSPAPASLLDDEDILREILLRLSPLPSSLPRASLVCKRWFHLLSDPQFLRHFRAHHHRETPLLGFFADIEVPCFNSTLDPPDRVPSARLSLAPRRDEPWNFLGCRHGLALLFNRMRLEITVWDPVTGDQRCVAVPPGWFRGKDACLCLRSAALLCDGGYACRVPLQAFKVVLLRHDWPIHEGSQAFASIYASVYASETGVWGDLISISVKAPLSINDPSILVGNSLFWLLLGYENGSILEFYLDRKSLAVIKHPEGAHVTDHSYFQILRMEDSALGLAISSDASIQLWERKTDSIGAARWMLQKTIEVDKLLSLGSPMAWQVILGYDEDGHVIFVSKAHQVFMIELKSMQFRKLFKSNVITTYHPYRSFYMPVRGTGIGDVGAEMATHEMAVH